jgi:hypothetical protein
MAEERVQRRLDAILAADVVGYSRLMGEDETGTLNTLNATDYRAGLYAPATLLAFFSASTPSLPVINTVVLLDLMAPPEPTASAIAAMLSLFGTSAMMTRS